MTRSDILRAMLPHRLLALASTGSFVVLAAVLVVVAGVPAADAVWASLAVALAFGPSGWLAPVGWRRRAAELALLPAAFVLTLVGDPTMRHMLLPPLLVLAAGAAVAAAGARTSVRRRPILGAALGLSVRAACGLGLAGFSPWAAAAAVAASALLPWGATRWAGPWAGAAAALAVGAAPLQRWPLVALGLVAVGFVLDMRPRATATRDGAAMRWLPACGAVGLIAASVSAWGGIAPTLALPDAGWLALAGLTVALVITPRLAPGVAGAAWCALALLCGPVQPAPPDRAGSVLTAERPRTALPAGTGQPYVLELALGNAPAVAEGVPVAVLITGGERRVLRAGIDAAEWAHERADVRPVVAHSLPDQPIWRPGGAGGTSLWGVAGRVVVAVPPGVTPQLRRHPALPDAVSLSVATAGPSRPTPPRRVTLPLWLWITAGAVAALQLLGGGWRRAHAVVPWTVLGAGLLVARIAVEPLRLLGERHAVDLCLLALVSAWLPPAVGWLRGRRPMLAAAALLVPLALATPALTPPMYGDDPFHLLILQSLTEDHDLDLGDDFDVEHHPDNEVYTLGDPFFHSPVTGIVLLPGYLAAGRTGALVLLSLVAAAMVALVLRRARDLGVPEPRRVMLGLLLAGTYPLATFATQIWAEVLGGFAVAFCLVAASARPPRRGWAMVTALVASVVKTRLALVTFPLAVAAWWTGGRDRRRRALGVAALAAAGLVTLVFGWLAMGHPFGYYRRLRHLLPRDLEQPLKVVGGLLFDPAGGLLFTAPLLVVAIFGGAVLLWRRGGPGERALLAGGVLTVLALLHSKEWYGGGSPPGRYLVPLLPALALAGAMVLRAPRRWRRLGEVLLAPSLLAWWVLISRPHFTINPGDGGYWLGDAVARRFGIDVAQFFPSFLVPTAAAVVMPGVVVVLTAALVVAARRSRHVVAVVVAAGTALWLVAAAALVAAVNLRTDRVVEVEAPQVQRLGGRPHPPPGTFSRFSHRLGWRVADQEGVVVPLHLGEASTVWLEGWLLGRARPGADLVVRWDDGEAVVLRVTEENFSDRLRLPDPPPGAGRHHLQLLLRCRRYSAAVFDRIVVGGA